MESTGPFDRATHRRQVGIEHDLLAANGTIGALDLEARHDPKTPRWTVRLWTAGHHLIDRRPPGIGRLRALGERTGRSDLVPLDVRVRVWRRAEFRPDVLDRVRGVEDPVAEGCRQQASVAVVDGTSTRKRLASCRPIRFVGHVVQWPRR